jgi:hypothetical protein
MLAETSSSSGMRSILRLTRMAKEIHDGSPEEIILL